MLQKDSLDPCQVIDKRGDFLKHRYSLGSSQVDRGGLGAGNLIVKSRPSFHPGE